MQGESNKDGLSKCYVDLFGIILLFVVLQSHFDSESYLIAQHSLATDFLMQSLYSLRKTKCSSAPYLRQTVLNFSGP